MYIDITTEVGCLCYYMSVRRSHGQVLIKNTTGDFANEKIMKNNKLFIGVNFYHPMKL